MAFWDSLASSLTEEWNTLETLLYPDVILTDSQLQVTAFIKPLPPQPLILFTFLLPSLARFLISLSERWWDAAKLIEPVWHMPRTLPHWPPYQRNNKTAKTKGSEEDFPWHDDVRDTVAVAEFTASFQRKLFCSWCRTKMGSMGLGPTAGSGYLATPKLGGLSDGIVQEWEEGEEEVEEGASCGKCSR